MIYFVGIIVLALLVFVHEYGHYSAAKLCGIPVDKFAIGFGPSILKFKRGETQFQINIFPFGGFVQLAGEGKKESDNPLHFQNQHWIKRLTVLLGGIFFNFFAALIVMVFIAVIWGGPSTKYIITGTTEGSQAGKYINKDDYLISINDIKIAQDGPSTKYIKDGDTEAKVVIERGGTAQSYIIPLFKQDDGEYRVGVQYMSKTVFVKEGGLLKRIGNGFVQTKDIFDLVKEGIKIMFSGQVSMDELGGPVTIVKATSDIAKTNFTMLLYWVVILNVNLGLMNALPIPALDGGQAIFLIIETIIGKRKWFQKTVFILNQLVLMLLLLFMLMITFKDIKNLF